MTYEAEVNDLVESMKIKFNMNDDEVLKYLSIIGTSKEKMSDDIETGVKNGMSVEHKVFIYKILLKLI